MLYCLIKGHTKNYELVSKCEFELHIFQLYFTPPHLKQNENKTTLAAKHKHHTRNLNSLQ